MAMREDPCRRSEPALAALEELEELALDAEEVAAARAHLAGCARCQARRRMWAQLDGALRASLAPTAATPALTTADLLIAIGADHEPRERRTPMLSVIYIRDEDIMDGDETRVTTAAETGQAANGSDGSAGSDGSSGAGGTPAGAPERHFAPLPSLAPAPRQPMSPGRRALMGLAAVVAVAALIAGITGAMSLTGRLGGPQSASHANATAVAAARTAQVASLVSQRPQIAGIAFNSSADGWIVMQAMNGNSSNSWLYHYANGKYTQAATPANWGLFNARLWSFAPDNLWVSVGAGGPVYHYDGHSWTQHAFPAPPNDTNGAGPGPSAMTMVSPTQGWAVGDTFIGPPGAQTLTLVFYHYDGSAWRVDPADKQASEGAPGGAATPTPEGDQYSGSAQIQLTGISATSDGDVWATGYLQTQDANGNPTSTTGYLYHRVNGVWHLAQTLRNTELNGVLMTGPNSGWIMGKKITTKKIITTVPLTETSETPIVLGWNGARWSSASIPQPDQAQSGMTMSQIVAASPSNVWLIGGSNGTTVTAGPYASDNTYLIHFDGVRWSRVSLPQVAAINPSHDIGITNQVTFDNLALTPSGDLWIAGALAIYGNNNYQSAPLLYRYSGGQWDNVQLPPLPAPSSATPASGNQPAG
jgi:hypothetical protein